MNNRRLELKCAHRQVQLRLWYTSMYLYRSSEKGSQVLKMFETVWFTVWRLLATLFNSLKLWIFVWCSHLKVDPIYFFIFHCFDPSSHEWGKYNVFHFVNRIICMFWSISKPLLSFTWPSLCYFLSLLKSVGQDWLDLKQQVFLSWELFAARFCVGCDDIHP